VPEIGHLNEIVGSYPINDAVSVFCSQERPITLEGIEHGRANFWKVAKEIEFGDNLILNGRR